MDIQPFHEINHMKETLSEEIDEETISFAYEEFDHIEEVFSSHKVEKYNHSKKIDKGSKPSEIENLQEETFEEFRDEILIVKASKNVHLKEHSYARKNIVVKSSEETFHNSTTDEHVEDGLKIVNETKNNDLMPDEEDFQLTTDEKMPPEDPQIEESIKRIKQIEAKMYYKVSLLKQNLLQTIINKNNATSPEENLLKSCLLNQQYQMIQEKPLTDRIFFQDL